MASDNSRRRRRWTSSVLTAGIVLNCAALARGGDCPIWEYHGYGIGEIDGDLLVYAGPIIVPTPVPITPRWRAAYAITAWIGAAIVTPTLAVRRMRRRRSAASAAVPALDRPAVAPYACGEEQPCRSPSK